MRFHVWRAIVLIGSAMPLALFLFEGATQRLGVDPGKTLVDLLGLTALWFLLITLAMSPLKALSNWSGWLAVRRQLGLWGFTYALLHILGYLVFLLELDITRLWGDLYKRPYVFVGAIAFVGLLALALTSNKISIRRLGRRWKKLHRAVYVILLLVLLHMLWVVRADLLEWAWYAGVALMLLVWRLVPLFRHLAGMSGKLKGRLVSGCGADYEISKKP